MTYNEYLNYAQNTMDVNTKWRRGQAYFNALWYVRPDLSERVRGTNLDPFHIDERIPTFLEFVLEHW